MVNAWVVWRADRDDPRVQAALACSCGVCASVRGFDCTDLSGAPLSTGIVHMARVPDCVLFDHRNGA